MPEYMQRDRPTQVEKKQQFETGNRQVNNRMGDDKSSEGHLDMEGKQIIIPPAQDHNPPQDFNPPPHDGISLADVMSKLEGIATLSQKIDSMAEDIKQIKVLQNITTEIGKDLSETKAHVKQLQGSVTQLQQSKATANRERSAMQATISQLKTTIASLEEEKEETQQNQQALAKELLTLRAQIRRQPTPAPLSLSRMEFEHHKIEAALRKNNLVLEGIKEDYNGRGSSTGEQVFTFIRNVLGLSGIELDMAYRLGRPRYGSAVPRPILVRFTRLGDRMEVWRTKYKLNTRYNSHFVIKEDLPPQLRPIQATLLKVVQEAKKYPDRYGYASIRDFKLFLDGRYYEVDQLETLPDKLRPSSIATPGNTQVVVFFGKDSKFSNHHSAAFTVDGTTFSSMEQYLAFSRARILQRRDLAERAMASEDPVDAKRVLHLLSEEPSQEIWEGQRKDVLFKGLVEKFSQNSDLKEYLLSSEDRTLGEASRNRVWGIGLTLADRYKLDSRHWNGDNLLGTTLMEVRKFLSDSTSTQHSPIGENHQPLHDLHPDQSPTTGLQDDNRQAQHDQGTQQFSSSDQQHEDHTHQKISQLNHRADKEPTRSHITDRQQAGQGNETSNVLISSSQRSKNKKLTTTKRQQDHQSVNYKTNGAQSPTERSD